MLYFTRWKALAIILTALTVCLCAVPNFFPEATVKTWPQWAQRHLVLGLDLQGGSHLLLEVDANAVRKDKLDQVRDDVRRVLRENKIVYTGLAPRADSVEVRVTKDTDLPTALSKLRELSQPLGGLPHPHVHRQPKGQAHRISRPRPELQPLPRLLGDAHGRPGRHPERDRSR